MIKSSNKLTNTCKKLRLTPSAEHMVRIIYQEFSRLKKDYGEEATIDLHELNRRYVPKARGKEYAWGTIHNARAFILNFPTIEITRTFTDYIFGIRIISFAELKKRRIAEKLAEQGLEVDCYIHRENDTSITPLIENKTFENGENASSEGVSEDEDLGVRSRQQQHYIWSINHLKDAGFYFAKRDIWEFSVKYSREAITKAVEYVKGEIARRKASTNPIFNPEGRLRNCLRYGHWRSLREPQRVRNFYQEVVDRFRESAVILASKFKELPMVEEFDFEGNWNGAGSKVSQLIHLLGEDWYGEELISSAIAWGEEAKQNQLRLAHAEPSSAGFLNQKQKPLSSQRRRGKGFAVQ